MFMTTKTITVTEDAYEKLKSRKLPTESFSEVITRITNNKALSDFFGILSKEDANLLEKGIKESRKTNRILSSERYKKLKQRFQ